MTLSQLINRFPIFPALISGILLVLIFPPFGLDFLAWVALVPLMLSISGREGFPAFKLGIACGILYFGGVMYWIFIVLSLYGHVWAPLAVIGTLFVVIYLSLYIGLYGWIVSLFGRSPEALLVSPLVFVLLEYARSYFLTGLPWALLAHSQAWNPSVIQVASLTGTAGVTFLIVLVNSSIAYFLLKRQEGRNTFAVPLAAIIIAMGNSAWGFYHINKVEGMGGRKLRASVIQGNIDQSRKWDPAFREEVISIYFNLTLKEAKEKPDIIVWPETAVPFYFKRDIRQSIKLLNLSWQVSSPLVFGGIGLERSPETGERLFSNRAFAISPKGVLGHYDKMYLVPFGEYVPLRKFLFFLDKITDAVRGDIIEGKSTIPIEIDSIPTGIQICYEIKFPELSRDFTKNGARLIINITNDAWFGRTGASAQHMASLPYRAVENRVPVIRAANTGISGFVKATGEVIASTGLYERTSLTRTITIPPESGTFYTRFGELFTFLCAVGAIIALWFFRRGKIKTEPV